MRDIEERGAGGDYNQRQDDADDDEGSTNGDGAEGEDVDVGEGDGEGNSEGNSEDRDGDIEGDGEDDGDHGSDHGGADGSNQGSGDSSKDDGGEGEGEGGEISGEGECEVQGVEIGQNEHSDDDGGLEMALDGHGGANLLTPQTPSPPVFDPQGSSRATGGKLRGRAIGRNFNFADRGFFFCFI